MKPKMVTKVEPAASERKELIENVSEGYFQVDQSRGLPQVVLFRYKTGHSQYKIILAIQDSE